MASSKRLRLTVDIYDQPRKWGQDRDGATDRRVKGEIFTPVHEEEYERLLEAGAAEDPAEVQKRAEQDLKARQAALKAEAAALEEQIGETASKVPEKLSAKQLDAELSSRGLATDGTPDEKRERLAAAQLDENPPAP